jgi:hypothetical protein
MPATKSSMPAELSACLKKQYLPATKSSVFLPQKAVPACHKKQCLPATKSSTCLPQKAVSSLPQKAVPACHKKQCLPCHKKQYLPATKSSVFPWISHIEFTHRVSPVFFQPL